MKYKKKPEIVEAVQFSWGMEDGIRKWNQIIPKGVNEYHPEMTSDIYPEYLRRYDQENDKRGFEQGDWRPYIITDSGDSIVFENDYIVTLPTGKRRVFSSKIFHEKYEPVEVTEGKVL